jgi:hypothetical protein
LLKFFFFLKIVNFSPFHCALVGDPVCPGIGAVGAVAHFEKKITKLPMKYWSQLALKD